MSTINNHDEPEATMTEVTNSIEAEAEAEYVTISEFDKLDTDEELIAIEADHFGGPPNSFFLCRQIDDDDHYEPINNQILVLNAQNELVPPNNQCQKCDKFFDFKCDLDQHMKSVHARPEECPECHKLWVRMRPSLSIDYLFFFSGSRLRRRLIITGGFIWMIKAIYVNSVARPSTRQHLDRCILNEFIDVWWY